MSRYIHHETEKRTARKISKRLEFKIEKKEIRCSAMQTTGTQQKHKLSVDQRVDHKSCPAC